MGSSVAAAGLQARQITNQALTLPPGMQQHTSSAPQTFEQSGHHPYAASGYGGPPPGMQSSLQWQQGGLAPQPPHYMVRPSTAALCAHIFCCAALQQCTQALSAFIGILASDISLSARTAMGTNSIGCLAHEWPTSCLHIESAAVGLLMGVQNSATAAGQGV